MDYLYADLCCNVQPVDYVGKESDTAKVDIDNTNRIIKVDVKPLPMNMILPKAPEGNGTYLLKARVVDGAPIFSWVSEDAPKTYIYFGTSTKEAIGELGDIQSLQNQEATDTVDRSIKVYVDMNEYFYYCVPMSLGECAFYDDTISGELGVFGMRPAYIIDKYYVYRSSYPSLGECEITVKSK